MPSSLRDHGSERVFAAEVSSAQINVDHGIPLLGRRIDEWAKEGPASARYQDVQATTLRCGGCHEAFDLRLIAHVGGDTQCSATGSSNLMGNDFKIVVSTRGQHDLDASLSKRKSCRSADA